MPWYRSHGKIETPLTEEEFLEAMRKGKFAGQKHKGFVALLYYTGVRKRESFRAKKEQFKLYYRKIYFDVGKRLKGGKQTPALVIPLKAAYTDEIWYSVENTQLNSTVWPYSDKNRLQHREKSLPGLSPLFSFKPDNKLLPRGLHHTTGSQLDWLNTQSPRLLCRSG